MRKLMIPILLFASVAVFGQCERATVWVFSLAPGYAKTGVTFSMEAGLWPAAGRIGVMAAPVVYSQQRTVKGSTETVTDLDVAGRLLFKITNLDNNSPQLFTLFATVRGNLGASYRAYISLGPFDLLGIEPFYGTKTGIGVNAIFTTRL